MEGLGIEIAGAFVDQAGDHVADAGLVRPDPGRAAAKAYSIAISGTVASCTNQASMPPGETRCWIFAAACEGADASSNSAAQAKRRRDAKRGARERMDGSRTLLLAFRRGRVLDQIAGHRALLVEPFLRGFADLLGGDGADAIRPAPDVVDAKPGGERAAIPARQRRLIVLGVDRLRDQLGLDPLEILGAGRIAERRPRSRSSIACSICGKLDAGLRRGRDRELRRIERGALIAGAGADRERLVDHQRAVKIGVAAAAHQLRQHVERRAFAGAAVVAEGTR